MVTIADYSLYRAPPRFLMLRLVTKEGVIGWGDPTVEGHLRPVASAVEDFVERYFLGVDIESIEDSWQQMYRSSYYRGGPILMSAIAGIDQALWDIKGKQFGAPVYELLGGKTRDKLRAHRWIGGDSPGHHGSAERDSLDHLVKEAKEAVDDGFSALKMHAVPKMNRIDSPAALDRAMERFEVIRETVGSEVDIGLDFHGRASKSMAKQLMPALEQYRPMFYEEPVLPEHNDSLVEIAAETSIPIATGERLYSRWDFKRLLESGAVDIVQPNVCHAGGLSELRKIGNMAESYDVGFSPIYPGGPVSFAACLHIGMHVPNFVIQFYGQITESFSAVDEPGYTVSEDGYLAPTGDPGLGVSIDLERLRESSEQSLDWQNPSWRHEDGSVAEW